MGIFLAIFLAILPGLEGAFPSRPSYASVVETVVVPAGVLRPTWLAPISKRRSAPQLIQIPALRAMTYAVTRDQFSQFLELNPHWRRSQVSSLFADSNYLVDWDDGSVNKKAPVTSVSWFAARAYCQSIGMRLPSVNEWEYLASASETKRDASSAAEFLRRILDWYGKPRGGELPEVGTTFRNVYGLWDLHGLIWEWVEDFNSTFVTGESREDSSFNKNMFCGAGSLSSADKNNYAAFMRFALRSSLNGRSAIWNLGFRCVQTYKK